LRLSSFLQVLHSGGLFFTHSVAIGNNVVSSERDTDLTHACKLTKHFENSEHLRFV